MARKGLAACVWEMGQMEIDNVSWVSPNFSQRSKPIEMITLHATVSATAKSALSWLCSPASQVSTHFVIDKTGKIFQLVGDSHVAWHAGNSVWHGLETVYKTAYKSGDRSVNDVALGIELVNENDGKDPYTPEQVAALTWLVEWKMHQYSIADENVVRHLDIATFYPSGKLGRKTDPAESVGWHWVTWKKGLTVGSDEQVWALWGTQFPLYPDVRHYGIPSAWFKVAAKLGEARSAPLYLDDTLVAQCFQHGAVFYRDGKTKVVLESEIGAS